jgi:hypothetical protein
VAASDTKADASIVFAADLQQPDEQVVEKMSAGGDAETA